MSLVLTVAAWAGGVFAALVLVVGAALAVYVRTTPRGAHHPHSLNEDDLYPPEVPDHHPAPPHPDGGTS